MGVYESRVGGVNTATYAIDNDGLYNYNNPNYINIEKNGYSGKSSNEWNTKADGTGTSYSQSNTQYYVNDFADLSTGDKTVTLYVNWNPNVYSITYNANGGSGAPDIQTYDYDSVDTINLSSTTPTRTGYTFLGWSLSDNASTSSYMPSQTWNKSNANNYTLYAENNA